MMDSSGDVPIIYNVRDVIGVATKGANSTMQMTVSLYSLCPVAAGM